MVRMCGGDPPAHDRPGVGVGDEADVGHPGPGRHVGQIGDPQLVRAGGGEVPVDQVRVPCGQRIRVGGPDLPGTPHPFDPGCPHQPGDLVTADVIPGPPGGLPELVRPVDPVVVHPELAQDRHHDRIAQRALRGRTGLDRVVDAGGHLQPCLTQDPTDGLDPQLTSLEDLMPVGVEELHHHRCWRSSSAPKKVAARRKISLARRSSRFSCSNALTRLASSVDTPGA